MRTKALILTAAISAVGMGTSMAQVFSLNAVGYYNVSLVQGFNLIANQFNNGGNTISEVFPVVPDGTSLLTWNSAGQTFNDADLYFDGLGWLNSGSGEPSTTVINPGGGVFVNTPLAADITMVGEVPEGTLTVTIPPLFSIVSQPTPQALPIDSAADILPANDGDSVLFYNGASQSYNDAILFFAGLGWLDSGTGEPSSPTPAVGHAFFYNNAGGQISWTRTFDVN